MVLGEEKAVAMGEMEFERTLLEIGDWKLEIETSTATGGNDR